ncbi:S1C family serine protease [Saccharospirillum mangrovi]|uniref:S1C family serine protease n=1 Tax=Saccharospirillum mangrovi TaxID=2161747 RepID=UPI000D3B1A6F|nr:trypsin-like peptidase domain-containing protein [Saccharospirillum mangrovi]
MSVPQSVRLWLAPIAIGLIMGGLFVVLWPNTAPPPPPGKTHLESAPNPASYADAIAQAQPSVVSIYSNSQIARPSHPLLDDPFFSQFLPSQPQQQTSLGSGVVIDDQGHILTNAHVIARGEEIVVETNDGQSHQARLVGSDPDSDLAVLAIESTELNAIRVNPDYRAQVGDLVFAIGNPFGVGQTVSMGIVSATGRHQPGLTRFSDFIQTDAAINPGNSGGALINARGELVGVNTAIFSNTGGFQGIGFAIPYAHALDIATQLIQQGEVMHGYLGIDVRPVAPQQRARQGLVTPAWEVADVMAESPADKAGVLAGDWLVSIDGKALSSRAEAVGRIAEHKPGDRLTLTLLRNHILYQREVILGERPR